MQQRYRNPEATWRVAQLIRNRLAKIGMHPDDLAKALNVEKQAKMHNLLSAKHYFPLELAKATCDVLKLDGSELVALILLQEYTSDTVEFVFEAIHEKATRGTTTPIADL